MKFISHRGNLEEKNTSEENKPEKILYCLSQGYDVEIDVWHVNNIFYLGHDEPQYPISEYFLLNKNLWCHAKNLNSLENMLRLEINCFWHQEDAFTITSKKFIWTYPGNKLTTNSIAVMPEKNNYSRNELALCYGICSDFIKLYKEKYV